MRPSMMRFGAAGVLSSLFALFMVCGMGDAAGQPVPAPPPPVPVVAAPPPVMQPGKPIKKKDDKKDEKKTTSDDSGVFTFPEETSAKNQLKAARDYMTYMDIPWSVVCSVLQNILDAKSDTFFRPDEKSSDFDGVHRISVKTEANRIIGGFKKEGLQFYQQTYGQTAAAMLKDAIDNQYDRATLSELSQRYFHTKAGAEATVLLGTIFLDRGNYLEASHAFERLLTRPDSDAYLNAKTLFKAALALHRSGDPRHVAIEKKVWDQLARQVARGGLAIGRKTYTADQLRKEIDRPIAFVHTVAGANEWTGRYGNAEHNAITEGGPPFLVPSFLYPMLHHLDDPDTNKTELKEGAEWVSQHLKLALRQLELKKDKSPALPAFFPLTAPDMVVFRSYDGVYAVASRDHTAFERPVRAGELRWMNPTDGGLSQIVTDGNTKGSVLNWWLNSYSQMNMASLLFENPLLGTLAHDGQNVYYVDDIAVPPPPIFNQDFGGVMPQQMNGGMIGKLSDLCRASKLKALNLQTGNLRWSLGGPATTPLPDEEEDKTTSAYLLCQDAFFLGPPLPLNGRLYSLIERNGRMRLLCLDPRNLVAVPPPAPGQAAPTAVPALIWSQRLGEPNNRLPSDSIRRFQGAFMAAGEGILVCPTNSGAVIGVDVMSRSLLWAYTYRKADTTNPDGDENIRLRGGPRGMIIGPNGQVMSPMNQLPAERWRAAAPIVSNGRVVFTAYDSEYLDCLDLRTGKLLWRVKREPTDLYVGGVVADKVIVVGKEDVRAYSLTHTDEKNPTAPKLAWDAREGGKTKIRTPSGHGVIGRSVFFVPVKPDPNEKDSRPEIWAVSVDSGEVVAKTTSKQEIRIDAHRFGVDDAALLAVGNLVFHESKVFAQSPWAVAAYPDLELKKAEMDRRLAANPKDPIGLTDRGELLLDKGKLAEAIADFKAAAAKSPPPEVERNIRQRLYQAYTEQLRTDFPAAEPFLNEYKGLCELPIERNIEPAEQVRLADENFRRQGLFLCLLAKGREKQGRLVEAFDNYLAFASLGDSKQLVPIFDEPNVLMRPDVWARGRIEAMVRKAVDPAARKPLEDRVQKEWDAVRAGNDLARLREFVDVFGPYFPMGSEAQLQLSETLILTNNEPDAREAQTHLAQLRATADDPVVRARATEALARVMVKSGLLEDAVGLYAQLGKEYGSVKVHGEKTGADYFNDLLTDKRLLPYLEPSRYQWPGRVKVRQEAAQPQAFAQSFVVEPEGELLPFYRRFRLVMDQNSSGNGAWTLRVIDRLTGEERCKFTNMRQVYANMYNGNGLQPHRFVQASGHLLLVHLGQWAYCLDLAERKLRWEYDLMGQSGVGPNPPTAEVSADGETTLRYEDGFTVYLGRAGVLQPNYVCLLTREELVALDPLSGKKLWARKNVNVGTQVYGDGRHVLLIETGTNKKPTATRLLRALDGAPVEDFKDFAKVLSSAKSYRIFGRTVLLIESSAEGPTTLRLYDAASGKDVWRKEFPAKAIPIRTLNPEWIGFVQPTGEMTILNGRTGELIGHGKLDAAKRDEQLKGCQDAVLLHDDERFYLLLNKDGNAVNGRRRVGIGGVYGMSILRSQNVNGPVYCFDRQTGQRKWFTTTQLENQAIVMEQFGDLPVLIASNNQTEQNNRANHRVVVLEKETGLLKFDRGLPFNGNMFYALTADPKAAKIELLRGDLKIEITADDENKTASVP